MMLSTVSSKPPAVLAALALAGAGAPERWAVTATRVRATALEETRTGMCMEKYTIAVNRTSLPTVYSSEQHRIHFFFDGAVRNASAPAVSRPDCHNRGRPRHDVRVRVRAGGARFRTERPVHPQSGREGRRRRRGPGAGRSGPPDLDRRGGQAGDGAEPRHPDSALRPADSGHRRLSRAIVLGAGLQLDGVDELRRSRRPRAVAGGRCASIDNGTFAAGVTLPRRCPGAAATR